MKENLALAKQEMKDKSKTYQTYGYYLSIPIVIIVVLITSFLGMNIKSIGTIILVFTILAHIGASKLALVSKRKYVAPILMYIAEAVGFVLGIILISELALGGTGDTPLILLGLIVFPIEIIAVIFFFITASDIKKAYPMMKQEATEAREKYMAIKKGQK